MSHAPGGGSLTAEVAAQTPPRWMEPAAPPSRPTRTVRDFFEAYRGAKVHQPPLVDDEGAPIASNSDRLMVLGTDLLFSDLDIQRVDNPDDADLLVLGARGGMHERSTWVPRIFRELCRNHPDTPMCVLPSTFYFPERPFRDEIGLRTRAPLTIFCREPGSWQHLRLEHELPDFVTVELDHDMAFELRSSPLVRNLSAVTTDQVVIAERSGVDRTSGERDLDRATFLRSAGRRVPPRLKSMLHPLILGWRSRRQTPFRKQCEAILAKHHRDASRLPKRVADICNVNVESFEMFCEDVARAEVVFTTRLHVGIFAGLLGRATYIFGGPYHRIRGVYEFSLNDHRNVTFLRHET